MRIDPLGTLGEPPEVLRALGVATARLGLPPPAALTGEWFGAQAVLAPSVAVGPVDPAEVFAVPPGSDTSNPAALGGGSIGYLSYPDRGADGQPGRIPDAAGGWTDCVLRRDCGGRWWYESLSGAAMPGWLTEALATAAPARHCHIAWGAADRPAHRAAASPPTPTRTPNGRSACIGLPR